LPPICHLFADSIYLGVLACYPPTFAYPRQLA